MWYAVVLLTCAIALVLMLFAPDGYINSELNAYQQTVANPWLHRIVALRYRTPQELAAAQSLPWWSPADPALADGVASRDDGRPAGRTP